jgi:phage shock protein C
LSDKKAKLINNIHFLSSHSIIRDAISEKVVFKDGMHGDMDEKPEYTESNPENTRLFIGVSLIVIGMLSLAKLLFDFSWHDLKYFIPVILVVLGAVLIYRSRGISE